MYSFIIVASLIIFIVSEKTFLHFSRTARRAFWYILSCIVGIWLVKWMQTIDGVGMVWIFLSAVLAASVVEDEVLKKTGLVPLNIEATHRVRAAYRTPEAQGKSERIMDIIGSITRGKGYTAGTKQLVSRVSGNTNRLQRSLHNVLASASPQELNYILCSVSVPAMIEVANKDTMELLVTQRLPVLGTVARAAIVDGLQKLGLRFRKQRQQWAKDIIVNTHGLDLTHFKAYIDDGGDYHTMYKLMYNDLQGDVQQQVSNHIKEEGTAVLKELQSRAASSSFDGDVPPGAVLKILSDIDDTVFASGGSFPAGVDGRYPKKCYYPGALALYAALDRCFAQKYSSLFDGMTKGHPELALQHSHSHHHGHHHVHHGHHHHSHHTSDNNNNNNNNSNNNTHSNSNNTNHNQSRLLSLSLSSLSTAASNSKGAIIPSASASASDLSRATSPHRHPSTTSSMTSPFAKIFNRTILGDLLTPRDRAATSLIPEGNSPRADAVVESSAPLMPYLHHQEGSNLVFLSARPESYKGLTESESYRKYFQPLVIRGDLDTSPTMLLGSLDSGPRALMKLLSGRGLYPDDPNPKTAATALYQTLAMKKLSRFKEYAAIYPEAAFLFVGDNGQGDVLCAEILYTSAKQAAGQQPSQLLASFIHKVVPPKATLSMLRTSKGTKEDWISAWEERKIFFHRTHIGMALQAYELGLLDADTLNAIATSATIDFKRVWSRYGGRYAGRHLDRAARHLNKDIAAMNEKLPSYYRVELVKVPDAVNASHLSKQAVREREMSANMSDVTGVAPMH